MDDLNSAKLWYSTSPFIALWHVCYFSSISDFSYIPKTNTYMDSKHGRICFKFSEDVGSTMLVTIDYELNTMNNLRCLINKI